MVEELNKIPGTKFHTPDGAFYMMVTLPVDDAEKLQYFLLEEFEDNGDTVMYAPGSGFYADPADGRSEIRIAYVHNCDYLRRAIQLLGKGIAAYNAKARRLMLRHIVMWKFRPGTEAEQDLFLTGLQGLYGPSRS